MQLSRNACALVYACFHPCVESLLQLPNPDFVERAEQPKESRHAQSAEPTRLVIRRRHGKVQERAFFVPHAAVVARHHPEAVVAGSEVAIKHLSSIAAVVPVAVSALKFVTKEDLFRGDEAQRGVIDL